MNDLSPFLPSKGSELLGTAMESAAGNWNDWYSKHPEGFPCGEDSYRRAAEYLVDYEVEEWGAGMSKFGDMHYMGYRAVDGSPTQITDDVVDLCNYQSDVEAILMRHVLEHNENWREIFTNLCSSFTHRAVVIFFTPFNNFQKQIDFTEMGIDVPVLSLAIKDVNDLIPDNVTRRWERTVSPDTKYGEETLLYMEKK